MSEILQSPRDVIIVGDFNIHIRDFTSNDVLLFNSTMDAFGFSQLIDSPTHTSGNTLDLVFINSNSKLSPTAVEIGPFLSDHKLLTVELNLKTPQIERKTIEFRSKKEFKLENFRKELSIDNICVGDGLVNVCNQLNNELRRTYNELHPYQEMQNSK